MIRQKKIAFIVESAHGHIIPTLGIARRLVQRGHRVSYAVKRSFASRVVSCGAEPKIYTPLETKFALFREARTPEGEFPFDLNRINPTMASAESQRETEDTLSKLEAAYRGDEPDLIIYDICNPAGKLLANEWKIQRIEHCPMMVYPNSQYHDERFVMVSVPKFLHENVSNLDARFHFVRRPELAESETQCRRTGSGFEDTTILASATTGLLPQPEFFSLLARALAGLRVKVHLSISDEISDDHIGTLPENFHVERNRPHCEILKSCRLFIGQGGPGGIVEAIAYGVPMLLLPPSQAHNPYARRVHDLGLGRSISPSELSEDSLRWTTISLLDDMETLRRVQIMRSRMSGSDEQEDAVQLIEDLLRTG